LRNVWRSLKNEYTTASEVDSWSSWLSALIDEASNTMPLSAVVEHCRNWDTDQWAEEVVTEQLYALADSESSSIVRNVVPVLRQWLLDRSVGMSADLIEQIMLVLSVDDVFSTQDLALFAELVSDLVNVAHTEKQYADAVSSIENCWKRVKSVNSLEHGLEIMDVLLDSVCANEQARLGYWNLLQEFCIANWDRLTQDQQLIVIRISDTAIGVSSQFPNIRVPEDEDTSRQIDLSEKKLAIYTLTEGAAKRASAVLADLFPGMTIKLNHDKTATDALVNLARTADYFVFASRSAAHQAFYPVTKARDDILYPTGKGSSSIVRCFIDAIQNEVSTLSLRAH
jgi:hypothetical protein